MRNFPKTKEDVFKRLDRQLNKAERLELAKAKNLSEYHFGLGMWIRNTWCYKGDLEAVFSGEEKESTLPFHTNSFKADATSEMVLEEYQKYLKKKYNV